MADEQMTFAQKLAMWQSAATPLTPEAQSRKIKEAKESQKQAVHIAKARAARYNMTLRSLAIKGFRDQTEASKKDLAAVRTAQAQMNKYNMTSRALAKLVGKNQANVAKAFDPEVDPRVAKDVIKAVARHQARAASVVSNPSTSEKQKIAAISKALEVEEAAATASAKAEAEAQAVAEQEAEELEAAAAAVAEDEDEEDDDDDEGVKPVALSPSSSATITEESAEETVEEYEEVDEDEEDAYEEDEEDDENEFVMDDLAKAVAEGDEDGVNRAILKEFLLEHAPQRLGEVDDLLAQYAGAEVSVLFEELIEAYPDPAEASQEGEQKALAAAKTGVDNEEDLDAEDEEDDVGIVEAHRQQAAAFEKREKEKIAAMSTDERERYFAEKEQEKMHAEKKDAMLKQQLDVYAKGGKKQNPVFAGVRSATTSTASESKRLSKKLDAGDAKQTRQPSVVGEGFILTGKVKSSKPEADEAAERETGGSASSAHSANAKRASVSSKWAVNVQPQVLRSRMKQAGVADKDIDALMSEESELL